MATTKQGNQDTDPNSIARSNQKQGNNNSQNQQSDNLTGGSLGLSEDDELNRDNADESRAAGSNSGSRGGASQQGESGRQGSKTDR